MKNENRTLLWLQLMAESAGGAETGAGAEAPEVPEDAQQEPEAPKPENLEAEFDALVKGDGKYKEIFGKRVQKAALDRNRSLRATVDRFNTFGPALEMMAARYGMSVDDPALADKIANDKSLLDTIDLEAEMQNPEFQTLLRNGVTMEGAYLALHFGEVKSRMAAKAEKKVTDAVAAGARRPRENGMGSQAGAAMKTNPAQMSKEEFNDYLRRVERGERISFST